MQCDSPRLPHWSPLQPEQELGLLNDKLIAVPRAQAPLLLPAYLRHLRDGAQPRVDGGLTDLKAACAETTPAECKAQTSNTRTPTQGFS